MKKHIPNLITSANLFCGCMATEAALSGNLNFAAKLIFLAAVFDFFDGMVARLLKVDSPLGKELDSLADVVSFGLVPSAAIYVLMQAAIFNTGMEGPLAAILKNFPFMIAVFSALRLAKFNIDTRQSEQFLGMPTPGNALFLVSVLLFWRDSLPALFNSPWGLAALTIFCSLWLVIEIPLIALKFKKWTLEGNEFRYALIFGAGLLFLLFQLKSIALIVILYLALSLVSFTTRRN